MLQDQGSKGESPAESEVNLLQELTHILHEYFDNPTQIPWKASIFGVEGVPLYINARHLGTSWWFPDVKH